ncbi:UPF0481 protein At3g47200-like [Alnus glutinosa]|uniref:UPF0481 protein At3g47200-like n=1 Tax=Alnus glutinosa TaxID=3517 RepID=UPI002D77A545|nr:UPF0481 protein At3g47200-like [Alnus glutinosa]
MGEASCVLEIQNGDVGLLAKMQERISKINPLLRGEPPADEDSCIFRLPPKFKEIQGLSYVPQLVSIGPYYRGKPDLETMEELKWQYLAYLVNSTKKDLEHYLESIRPLEKKARDCYAGVIDLNSDDFLEMMVLDAILGTRYDGDMSRFYELKYLHLLDLARSIFIPPDDKELLMDICEGFPLEYRYRPVNTIPCISKLRRAGIKVKRRKKDSFLVVEFLRGEIEMPNIILNDLMCSFLVNCVAFEQCHNNSSKHFSVNALFLDCLVNTADDVEYLCDHLVIENYIETDTKAASFINNLGKGLAFDWDYIQFFNLCFLVNEYYRNRLNRQWTSLKREYFDKPWLWISGSFALVIFFLSFLQTYYTIHPKH